MLLLEQLHDVACDLSTQDKLRGTSAGYGFVRFATKDTAEQALQSLNGKEYLGMELRVNWALPNHHKEDTGTHFHIFVGDLGSEVTDAALFAAFAELGVQCS
jgi:nucleolysin TIA-1/TIAR